MYINNVQLLAEIEKYYWARKVAMENGDPEPKIPDSIGLAILQISNNIAKRHNFAGYTYREEMIGDGVVDCVKAVKTFDPTKSNNPFGYFTMIIFRAFIRRIQSEKRAHETKNRLMFDDEFPTFSQSDGDDYHLDTTELYIMMND